MEPHTMADSKDISVDVPPKPTAIDDKARSLESGSVSEERPTNEEERREQRRARYQRFRPFILVGIALVILGWWISATVLEATRHRW